VTDGAADGKNCSEGGDLLLAAGEAAPPKPGVSKNGMFGTAENTGRFSTVFNVEGAVVGGEDEDDGTGMGLEG